MVAGPGVSMGRSFVSDAMGGSTWRTAHRRNAGEKSKGIAWGAHENWMVFQRPVKGQPGVFEVQRDRINKLDRIRLAPLVSLPWSSASQSMTPKSGNRFSGDIMP